MAKEIEKPDSAANEALERAIYTEKKTKKYQDAADAAERERRANEMQTQGRTGCKLDRLNLSITPENMEYVKVRAAQYGQTYSRTINNEITKAREDAEKNDPYYVELRSLRREQIKREAKR